VSQVLVRRPFGKLDLRNKSKFKPTTIFHLFTGERKLRAFLLWQVSEWTTGGHQPFQLLPNFTAQSWHEAVSHLASVDQLITVVIADDQRIERIAGRVTADDELL
jgi:hypothetical protein